MICCLFPWSVPVIFSLKSVIVDMFFFSLSISSSIFLKSCFICKWKSKLNTATFFHTGYVKKSTWRKNLQKIFIGCMKSHGLYEGRLCLPLSGQKSQSLATNQLKSSGIIWTFPHSSKRKHETKQLFKIWYI